MTDFARTSTTASAPEGKHLGLGEAVRKYGPCILFAEGVSTHIVDNSLSSLSGELPGSTYVYVPGDLVARIEGVTRAVDERDPERDVVLVYAARNPYEEDGEPYPWDIECGIALDTPEGRAYVFGLDDLWSVHRMRRADVPSAIAERMSQGLYFDLKEFQTFIGAPPVFESKELDEHPTAGPQSDASPSTSEAA